MDKLSEFAKRYAESGVSRFHMPGHKGVTLHGLEAVDLTEIKGADFLFEPDGVIADGERLTADAYGSAATCWSAEGTSLSIKAAVCMVRQYLGRDITVASPRNCHRAFLNACTLLGIDPVWIYPADKRSLLCECAVTPDDVRKTLLNGGVDAIYITSPDYLGGMADIRGIAKVCREFGALLIVDNAHGAYLKFVGNEHPLGCGADIVCDSAHKTLPVYTGGGYLHISKSAPKELVQLAKPAMAMFGSTSPSYLIMQSLGMCAEMLTGELPQKLRDCCERTAKVKALMKSLGIPDLSAEPMKITVGASKAGYDGGELAELMRENKMECEYSDPDAVVLMLSPYNTKTDFERLERFFMKLEKRIPLHNADCTELFGVRPEKVMSLRSAMLSPCVNIPVDESEGRICARTAMSCQPSVAAVMAGERISAEILKILKRYSIFSIDVI